MGYGLIFCIIFGMLKTSEWQQHRGMQANHGQRGGKPPGIFRFHWTIKKPFHLGPCHGKKAAPICPFGNKRGPAAPARTACHRKSGRQHCGIKGCSGNFSIFPVPRPEQHVKKKGPLPWHHHCATRNEQPGIARYPMRASLCRWWVSDWGSRINSWPWTS